MKPGRYTIKPTFAADPERLAKLTREVDVIETRDDGFVLVEEAEKDQHAGKLWSRGDRKVISPKQWDFAPVGGGPDG